MITIRNRWHAAQLLKHFREAQRLTRVDLARRLFVSSKTIGNREQGVAGIALDAVIDTARALGYQVALIRTDRHETGTGWPA